MNKVIYIARRNDWETSIFSTRELAEKYIDIDNEDYNEEINYDKYIEEFVLDSYDFKNEYIYYIEINFNSCNIRYIGLEEDTSDINIFEVCSYFGNPSIVFKLKAKNQKDAINIAYKKIESLKNNKNFMDEFQEFVDIYSFWSQIEIYDYNTLIKAK